MSFLLQTSRKNIFMSSYFIYDEHKFILFLILKEVNKFSEDQDIKIVLFCFIVH